MSNQLVSSERTPFINWETKAFEDQTEWNRVLFIWKSFKRFESNLIKSFIGLTLFGPVEGQDDINMETYFNKYDANGKQLINNVFRQLQYDNGRVILAQTYLYLSYNNCRTSVFRQLRPTGNVEFIDIIGRVYTSWDHFVKTNELPKCDYIAPDDGIYKVNGKLKRYESPKKGVGSILLHAGDYVAGGASLGAIGLSMVAMAPVTALALGVGGTAYCVGRSIGMLVDRNQHRQSIKLDNMESVISWLSIATSAVTGISSVGLMNSARIIELSGEYSSIATSALKGLNYAALTSNVMNFGTYLVHFQKRAQAGELSSLDVLELCFNVFLIYGTVVNVRQMHKYLNTVSSAPRTTGATGLTKTVKRRLQRLRAKMRKAGVLPNTVSQESVMEVNTWDMQLPQICSTASTVLGGYLMRNYPIAYQIYCQCCDIVNTIKEFCSRKLNLPAFVSNMTNHITNLYTILKTDMENIIRLVRIGLEQIFVGRIYNAAANEVAEIIDNGIMAVNNLTEDFPEMDDNSDSSSDLEIDDRPKYEIILDTVKQRVSQMCNNSTPTEEILSTFSEILSCTAERVTTKIQKDYDEMIAFNYKAIGEEKTKAMLTKIGINSRTDFANRKFVDIINDLKLHSVPSNPLAPNTVLNQLFAFYKQLFYDIAGNSNLAQLDAEKTSKILNRTVTIIMKPLIENFTFAKTFFHNNSVHFGTTDAKTMLIAYYECDPITYAYKNPDANMFLEIAYKQINMYEVMADLFEIIENYDMEFSQTVDEFDDNFIILNLISLCGYFYKKIYSNVVELEHHRKPFKKVCYFITNKFVDTFKSIEKDKAGSETISSKLKQNDRFFSRKDFIDMCKGFNEIRKREIFDQVVEKFRKKSFVKQLISEYSKEMMKFDDVNVEIWKELVAEDGMKIYTVEISKFEFTMKYISIAAELYGLPSYTITLVSKTDNLIVLKTNDKYIMFQFEDNEKVAFIMQVDMSSVVNDEDDLPELMFQRHR